MSNEFKISRQKLYEEIWDISTSKVAKKYNLSYNKLQQACKKANIPLIVFCIIVLENPFSLKAVFIVELLYRLFSVPHR